MALMIQAVGQRLASSKSESNCSISSCSLGLVTSGAHMKMVWHNIIDDGTVSGELLLAPQIAPA